MQETITGMIIIKDGTRPRKTTISPALLIRERFQGFIVNLALPSSHRGLHKITLIVFYFVFNVQGRMRII